MDELFLRVYYVNYKVIISQLEIFS
jgi:hypothetical protein